VLAIREADQPSPVVRTAVRDLLSSCQAYHTLPLEERKSAAQAMVKVCQTAVSLMQEEARADLEVKSRTMAPKARAVAAAQSAGQEFSGVSASRVAGTTRDILNAVSFPRFVTELISGVFRAMVDSNRQQMTAYVELIKNVAASVDGFAETNLGHDQARQWLVDTFPGSFVIEGGADEDTAPEDRAEENQSARVRLREGASMPSDEALRSAFGLAPGESVPSGDPENALVPFARRAIARQRQQVLSTMVMLGLQRIVIESGRLHAAMRFHIDTRSAATAESGSRFNLENQTSIKANYWGVEAAMKNTIGYVSTQKQTSSEEMNTDLDLNSSVELVFKTDYLPLDRVAGKGQVDRIKVNTINPEAEERIASQERQARLQGERSADAARNASLDSDLRPAAAPAAPAPTPAGGNGTKAPATQQPKGKPAKTATPGSAIGSSGGSTGTTPGQPANARPVAKQGGGQTPAARPGAVGQSASIDPADGNPRGAVAMSVAAADAPSMTAQVQTGPPSAIAGWPLGVDLSNYQNQVKAAGFTNLKNQGKAFAIAKSSQGVTQDGGFADRYRWIHESGLIRGSYHFFSNKNSADPVWGGSVSDQADKVIALVKRLSPGDLAPALDLEDELRNPANGRPKHANDPPNIVHRFPLDQGLRPTEQGYRYRRTPHNPNWQVGRDELLTDIQDFMDRIETSLGRTPLLYTSTMWKDSDMMNDPQVMSGYPLWTVYHGRGTLADLRIGAWGNNWDFVQYAEEGGNWWGLNPYKEPNINVGGLDFDAYQGTIYDLRGLAEIGRPAIAADGALSYIAHSETDDSVHLLTSPKWTESQGTMMSRQDLMGSDPAMLAFAGSLFLYFRQGDHVIEATVTPAISWDWQTSMIENVAPVHDPRAIIDGAKRYVVYWGVDDDWHLLAWDNLWLVSSGILSQAGVKRSATEGRASGQPVVYVSQGAVHVIGRAGVDGHLYDVWFDGSRWNNEDTTALAQAALPFQVPAATYSPCVYETWSGVGVVFRGVRGDLWLFERNRNIVTNLTEATGAKSAAGHPTCFVMNFPVGQEQHIVYRGTDRLIYDIFNSLHDSSWHVQQVCPEIAAADPAVSSDGAAPLVAFRASNGIIQTAQLDGTIWICNPAQQDIVG
jgi:GH25 family lysozyme M1 (1,4-beta-N-acetylmuramidase)